MEFRGKERTYKEVSRMTGLSPATLHYRYRNLGLRGEDIVTGVLAGNKEYKPHVTFYIDGEGYTPSREEMRKITTMRMNAVMVQQRLDEGWPFDMAIGLGEKYVTYQSEICIKFVQDNIDFFIPFDDLQELHDNKITVKKITQRMNNGWEIYQLTLDNTRVFEEQHTEAYTQDIRNWSDSREQKMFELKEAKLRESRPWLFDGTSQEPVKKSRWVKYLEQNDVFVKVGK